MAYILSLLRDESAHADHTLMEDEEEEEEESDEEVDVSMFQPEVSDCY